MAIQTHPELRKLGLFWKKDPAPTGRYKSFDSASMHGRGYSLIHRDSDRMILFTSYYHTQENYKWWLVVRKDANKVSKASFTSQEAARLGAEAFAVSHLDKIKEWLND